MNIPQLKQEIEDSYVDSGYETEEDKANARQHIRNDLSECRTLRDINNMLQHYGFDEEEAWEFMLTCALDLEGE